MARKVEELEEELTKGLEAAIQLRGLLNEGRIGSHESHERAKAFGEYYANIMLKSFDTSISILNNVAVDTNSTPRRKKRYSQRSSKLQPTTIDAPALTPDGHAWRKYGEKLIVNAKYPREYYKCAYTDQDCKATKQVQKTSEDPQQYRIIYHSKHTCQPLLDNNSIEQHISVLGSSAEDSAANLISFSSSIPNPKQSINILDLSFELHEHQEHPSSLDYDATSNVVPDCMKRSSVAKPTTCVDDNEMIIMELDDFASLLDFVSRHPSSSI